MQCIPSCKINETHKSMFTYKKNLLTLIESNNMTTFEFQLQIYYFNLLISTRTVLGCFQTVKKKFILMYMIEINYFELIGSLFFV